MIGHNGGPAFDRSDRGWIAISRTMRGHPLVGFHLFARPADANRGAMQPALAFIDLLMECRYEDGYVLNAGRKMAIQRGQMIGAVSWLANRWNWTPMAVRVWLDKLEADAMISRFVPGASESNKHVGKAATVIRVCNYDVYQPSTSNEQPSQQQTSNKRTTNEQQQYKDNKGTREQDIPPTPKGEVDRKSINRDAAKQAFVQWQALASVCGLTVPRDTSFETYGQKIAGRMFEHAAAPKGVSEMLDVWQIALANVERSSFLRGLTAAGFRADLKFICQRESFAKLVDGGYGNGAHAVAGAGGQPKTFSEKARDDAAIRQLDAIVSGGR